MILQKQLQQLLTILLVIFLQNNGLLLASEQRSTISPVEDYLNFCMSNKDKNPFSVTQTGIIYWFKTECYRSQNNLLPHSIAHLMLNKKGNLLSINIQESIRAQGINQPLPTTCPEYDQIITYLSEHCRTNRTQFGNAKNIQKIIATERYGLLKIEYEDTFKTYSITPHQP